MDYLTITNALLRRLRLDDVAGVQSTTYSKLLGEHVNEAKREVEDAFDWLALETSLDISTTATVDTYTLTGFGQRGKVRRVHNLDRKGEVLAIQHAQMDRYIDFSNTSNSQTAYWRLNGTSGEDPQIQFFPTPDATYSLTVYGIVPQADLSSDADMLTVPYWPVLLGAYALAVAERGDDRGNPVTMAQLAYQSALSDAIAIDNGNRMQSRETDWFLDPKYQ